jgi:hypothetical protein
LTYAPARPVVLPEADATTHRNVTKWIAALALFFTFLAFLVFLQAFLITSEGSSERTLRRALAVVSEIDVLLDRHYEDLQQRAEAAAPNETLELQDFPVTVPLTPEEVRTQSRDELRETLLERGAGSLYENGTGEMRTEDSTGDVAVFSVGGSIDRSLNLLRDDVHLATGIAMIVLGAIALLLTGLLAATTRGLGRVVAPGFVALATSVVLLLFALLARLGTDTDGGDEYVKAEFLDMAREIMWLPIRNGAILVAVSALVTVMAVAGARIMDASRERAGTA